MTEQNEMPLYLAIRIPIYPTRSRFQKPIWIETNAMVPQVKNFVDGQELKEKQTDLKQQITDQLKDAYEVLKEQPWYKDCKIGSAESSEEQTNTTTNKPQSPVQALETVLMDNSVDCTPKDKKTVPSKYEHDNMEDATNPQIKRIGLCGMKSGRCAEFLLTYFNKDSRYSNLTKSQASWLLDKLNVIIDEDGINLYPPRG